MQGAAPSSLDCATGDKMIIRVTKNRDGRCMMLILHEYNLFNSLEGLISAGEDDES